MALGRPQGCGQSTVSQPIDKQTSIASLFNSGLDITCLQISGSLLPPQLNVPNMCRPPQSHHCPGRARGNCRHVKTQTGYNFCKSHQNFCETHQTPFLRGFPCGGCKKSKLHLAIPTFRKPSPFPITLRSVTNRRSSHRADHKIRGGAKGEAGEIQI
jgi:hypothetical protein